MSEVVFKSRPDGLTLPKVGPSSPMRKPLGLRPANDDNEPREAAAIASGGLDETSEYQDPTVNLVMQAFASAEQIIRIEADRLRVKITGLETENARLRAQFAEARAEFVEAKHIVERLQISREGKRGERGPCGADGAPGPRGERGPRGESGLAAPRIAAWEPRAEKFEVVPRFANGDSGPPICLLSLFQAFYSATEWLEDADIEQAAERARAENEQAAERSRWAR